MPTRNVVLTEHQADFVERLVTSGRYQNASEVLRDGLRLVEQRDAEERACLKALREAAKQGIADADAARFTSFESSAAPDVACREGARPRRFFSAMSEAGPAWQVRLTHAAEADFRQIVRWTAEQFGERQAVIYARTLSQAVEDLTGGPDIPGAQRRDEIRRGLRSIHVARGGRRGRHFVIFRSSNEEGIQAIEVLRLLHDAMDIGRHLSGKS